MKHLLLLLAVSVAGCGGLNHDMSGVWSGTLVLTLDASQPFVSSTDKASLTVLSDGDGNLDLVVCPDRTGKLRLEGVGNKGTWSGIQSCPAAIENCPTASYVFRNATVEVMSGPRVKIVATGTANSCPANWPLTIEFSGTK